MKKKNKEKNRLILTGIVHPFVLNQLGCWCYKWEAGVLNDTVSIFLFWNFVKGYGFAVAANLIKVKIVDIDIGV